MYAIIFNFSFLLTNIDGVLFALDLLLGIGPIIFNIVYLSVPKDCRLKMIPDGWPNLIFITVLSLIGIFFLGFILYYSVDLFQIHTEHLDGQPKPPKMFAIVNYVLDIFMIIFYTINCVMMYTFFAYTIEFKRDQKQRALIIKIKQMQEEESRIKD